MDESKAEVKSIDDNRPQRQKYTITEIVEKYKKLRSESIYIFRSRLGEFGEEELKTLIELLNLGLIK